MTRYRLGIDVGGTFTDFVIAATDGSAFDFHKEPSIPDDPSVAVLNGAGALIERLSIEPADIELIVHGTTLALNAIIQRKGCRVALVVSSGNRDIMEIARARMPNSYDFTAGREVPLIPRDAVFEVSARGLADGSVLREADPEQIRTIAKEIADGGFDAVAVMLLNSYRDGALEMRVADLLQAELPSVLITASSDLWPEMREYERALVTCLNAYVHPAMNAYFSRLQQNLSSIGVSAPIYITANNGGTISLESARKRPIDTILSGPASGVLAATRTAREYDCLLTFDMGGTSTDIALSRDNQIEFTNTTYVGDFPLMLPVVNVSAIGAGGGSVVWVDEQGVLKVGPQSAGADPGPICYGKGGLEPTITDCYLQLGYLNAERFLDGRMQLDPEKSNTAIVDLQKRLGFDGPMEVAVAAVRVATAKMATELRKLLAQNGLDPKDFVLVAYGGAGATHANLLAEEAGIESILIPRRPGTFCALGAILGDVRRDYVRPVRRLIGRQSDNWAMVLSALDDVVAEALEWVAAEGEIVGEHDVLVSFDMRYPDQAFELEIKLQDYDRDVVDAQSVISAFNDEHFRLYGFMERESDVQITNLRVAIVGKVSPIVLAEDEAGPQAEPMGMRKVVHDRVWDVPVYDREAVRHQSLIQGPAIIEQPDSTVWILPGWQAVADRFANLVLKRTGV